MANQRLIYGFHAVNARLWQNPKSITEPGVYSSGIPLQTNKEWRKTAALTLGIDGLNKRIKALEKKLKSDE